MPVHPSLQMPVVCSTVLIVTIEEESVEIILMTVMIMEKSELKLSSSKAKLCDIRITNH